MFESRDDGSRCLLKTFQILTTVVDLLIHCNLPSVCGKSGVVRKTIILDTQNFAKHKKCVAEGVFIL